MKHPNSTDADTTTELSSVVQQPACSTCGGYGMLPGLYPNDDVMNIPCHQCNDWAVKSADPSIALLSCESICMELKRYREREKICETMDQAEKLALIRALQEIRDVVGLFGDGVSPREIVEAVRRMKSNV